MSVLGNISVQHILISDLLEIIESYLYYPPEINNFCIATDRPVVYDLATATWYHICVWIENGVDFGSIPHIEWNDPRASFSYTNKLFCIKKIIQIRNEDIGYLWIYNQYKLPSLIHIRTLLNHNNVKLFHHNLAETILNEYLISESFRDSILISSGALPIGIFDDIIKNSNRRKDFATYKLAIRFKTIIKMRSSTLYMRDTKPWV